MNSTDTSNTAPQRAGLRWLSLSAGPVLALCTYLLLPEIYVTPAGETLAFAAAGRATLAVMVWMATWWLTEAIDVAVTALLPVALFPLFGIAGIKAATAPYASDLIFLFLGGFIIALAMQRWGLDRRVALSIVRLVGTEPRRLVGGFMLATALLSAFVSNTATAAMMLPIALSIVDLVLRQSGRQTLAEVTVLPEVAGRNFALCLMLGIAYAASIGGIATIIGTPPNLFLVSFIRDTIEEPYRQDIGFMRWLAIGVPLTAIMLPLTWLLLTRVLYPIRLVQIPGGGELIAAQYRELGPVKRGEWLTLMVFLLTALTWIGRPFLPVSGLSDSGIAVCAAVILFVLPAGGTQRQAVMDWDSAKRLPWGILLLFGGGLSLAAAIEANGVAEFIGAQTTLIGHWPALVLVLIVVAAVIFLTELTSNTATTATLVPLLAALAPGLNMHPYQLIIPAALAASCAFMMPVATPPNAIVFGSGHISIAQMCKAGFWLNLIAIGLITSLMYSVVLPGLLVKG